MTYILDKILNKEIPITLEAPIIRDSDQLYEFIKYFLKHGLENYILALNLTNYPMGILSPDPVALGCYLKRRLEIDVIPHITASVEREYTLIRSLLTASICRINELLILGGDIRDAGGLDLGEVYDIIKMFEKGYVEVENRRWKIHKTRFCLGGALIPYRKDELERALWKIDKGIRFFQTQIVVNKDRINRLLSKLDDALNSLGINKPIPILVGITPFESEKVFKWIRGNIEEFIESRHILDDYEKHIFQLSKDLIKDGEKLNNLHIGIHIIPIEWSPDTYGKIRGFIDKLF